MTEKHPLYKRAVSLGVIKAGAQMGGVTELAKKVASIDPDFAAQYLKPEPQEQRPQTKRRGRPPKPGKKDGRQPYQARRQPLPDQGADPKKGKRWVRIFDADVDRILNSQAPERFQLAFAVWYALVREASYRRSLTFEASDGFLSKRIPGMRSRMTIRKGTLLLQSLGLLTSEAKTIAGTKQKEPLVRTLHPSGDMGFQAAEGAGEEPAEEPGEVSFA
jgi:hypothetical protein